MDDFDRELDAGMANTFSQESENKRKRKAGSNIKDNTPGRERWLKGDKSVRRLLFPIGKKVNCFTIIERVVYRSSFPGRSRTKMNLTRDYIVKCDCGDEGILSYIEIHQDLAWSCGKCGRERPAIAEGGIVGDLDVMREVENGKKPEWECVCRECGEIIQASEKELRKKFIWCNGKEPHKRFEG